MLVLLDIDGVMVTTPSWKRPELLDDNFSRFNERAVMNLSRIISETDATIVLTTSHKSNFSIPEWKNIFQRRGLNVTSIEKLNDNNNHSNRKDEVLNWLSSRNEENYVIIDDDKSLYDLPSDIKNKCVITSPLIGLTENDALTAINVLQTSNRRLARA